MKLLALIILTINSFCAFSQIHHEVLIFGGCSDNGTWEVQVELDAEEFFYVDFDKEEVVYTWPSFVTIDPSQLSSNRSILRDAMKGKADCPLIMKLYTEEYKNPTEEADPPESILYPSEEVELGVENSLICFVNHFYPPGIKVSWTRNGHPVSEGTTLSRYYPNNDQTFHQFSTLTFTPGEGDIYSCTVEHLALDGPKTRIWEADFGPRNLWPDVYCGVGLTLGLLGVTAGTFLIVKGHHG